MATRFFEEVLDNENVGMFSDLFTEDCVFHRNDLIQPTRGIAGVRSSHRGHSNTLHLFWDINLVEMVEGSTYEVASALDASLSTKERISWQSGNPKTWTDESFKLSRSYAYNLGNSTELSDKYVADALPIVRRRLLQSGVRLSWLLNNVFK